MSNQRHVRIARPIAYQGSLQRKRTSDRMEAVDEILIDQSIEHVQSHASHNPHAHHDVGRIRYLDPDARQRRSQRSHTTNETRYN